MSQSSAKPVDKEVQCSLLMTQWNLTVKVCSIRAAVSADAQLTETTLWPQQHKGSPASTFSQLQLFTSKASLFTVTPDAFGRCRREKVRRFQMELHITMSWWAPSCAWYLQLQLCCMLLVWGYFSQRLPLCRGGTCLTKLWPPSKWNTNCKVDVIIQHQGWTSITLLCLKSEIPKL